MAMVINSNIQSLNAQRNLSISQGDQNQAMERLTSGKRINSAADDAAGLAISSKMTSQIKGLDQAVRNANDGISLIQTAEGALEESTNILQRMRELSIQSANGIFTDDNRSTLNAEVDQLKAELTRISETTSFNGLQILDGSQGDIALQVGSEANQTMTFNLGSGFGAAKLGAAEGGVSSGSFTLAETTSVAQSGAAGTLNALSAGDLEINGVAVPAAQTSSDLLSSTDNAASGISLATAINSVSDDTGVVAEVKATAVTGLTSVDPTAGASVLGDLTINGVAIGAVTFAGGALDADNLLLQNKINEVSDQTGVTATYNSTTSKMSYSAADGRNIEIAVSAAASTQINNLTGLADGSSTTTTAQVTLRSNEAIEIAGNDPSSLGLTAGAVAANTTQALENTLSNAATATLTYTATATDPAATGPGDFVINGTSIIYNAIANDADASRALLTTAINDEKDITGVTAVDDGTNIVLTAAAGVDIAITSDADVIANADQIGIQGTTITDILTTAGAEAATATATSPFTALGNGDLTVNGFTVDFAGTTPTDATEQSTIGGTASAMFNALAINNPAGLKEEVVATAYTEMNLGKVEAGAATNAFSLAVNGTIIDIDNAVLAGDASGSLVGQLNTAFAGAAADSDVEGLVASVNDDGELLITAADGRNITVSVGATANGVSLLEGFDTTVQGSVTTKGTITLAAKDGFNVGEIGGDKRTLAGIESGQGAVADLDISTAAGAQEAIATIDTALETVNNARSNMGAITNRLDFTINNLSSISQSTSEARSRIEDADFAQESAALSRAQVLQQAGTAMLAQANSQPQQVLSLLQ